jgi:hypothetical protein
METEHEHEDERRDEKGALDADNPQPPEGAGEKGAGDQTGAAGGMERGTEPEESDARSHERP